MPIELGALTAGDCGRIVGYSSAGHYRRQVLVMGLTPGIVVRVVRRAPLGDPIELEVRGFKLSLRRKEARIVLVEKEVCGADNHCRSR